MIPPPRPDAELRDWIEESLDAYKPEMRSVLFPLFVSCYLSLVRARERELALLFYSEFQQDHALCHRRELNELSQLTLPEHLDLSPLVKRLEASRWEVKISAYAHALLLHTIHSRGLAPLLHALNERVHLVRTRLQPDASLDDGKPGGVVAAAAAARMWAGMSDDALAEANRSEQASVCEGRL